MVVGSAASFCNGGSRFFFGMGYDILKFRFIYSIMMILNIVIYSTIYFVNDNKYIYPIYVGLATSLYGGNFAIFPAFTVNNFGIKIGAKVYSYMLISMMLANFG
jgi:hypothetical protein